MDALIAVIVMIAALFVGSFGLALLFWLCVRFDDIYDKYFPSVKSQPVLKRRSCPCGSIPQPERSKYCPVCRYWNRCWFGEIVQLY